MTYKELLEKRGQRGLRSCELSEEQACWELCPILRLCGYRKPEELILKYGFRYREVLALIERAIRGILKDNKELSSALHSLRVELERELQGDFFIK
jgi:hypothetical protein